MKKIILFSVYCIVTGFLLSSCGTNFSLLKRHYTKGYYVEHGSGKHRSSVSGKEIKSGDEIADRLHSQFIRPDVQDNFVDIEHNESATTPIVTNGDQQDKEIARVQKGIIKKREISQRKFPERMYSKLVPVESDSDKALSFMWIVITIIFLIWLIGFLAGGFGLGNLIHLLLVVVLILLILWLLRII
jgi:hypothetical protein